VLHQKSKQTIKTSAMRRKQIRGESCNSPCQFARWISQMVTERLR